MELNWAACIDIKYNKHQIVSLFGLVDYHKQPHALSVTLNPQGLELFNYRSNSKTIRITIERSVLV